MISDVTDRRVMQEYATAVRQQPQSGELDHAAAGQALGGMPSEGLGGASSEHGADPFVGRDPIVSLLQTIA